MTVYSLFFKGILKLKIFQISKKFSLFNTYRKKCNYFCCCCATYGNICTLSYFLDGIFLHGWFLLGGGRGDASCPHYYYIPSLNPLCCNGEPYRSSDYQDLLIQTHKQITACYFYEYDFKYSFFIFRIYIPPRWPCNSEMTLSLIPTL